MMNDEILSFILYPLSFILYPFLITMALIRLILLVAVLGGITLLLLQNWSPVLPLVFLGVRSQPLPLAIWILFSTFAGGFTTILLNILFNLSGSVGDSAKLLCDRLPNNHVGTKLALKNQHLVRQILRLLGSENPKPLTLLMTGKQVADFIRIGSLTSLIPKKPKSEILIPPIALQHRKTTQKPIHPIPIATANQKILVWEKQNPFTMRTTGLSSPPSTTQA